MKNDFSTLSKLGLSRLGIACYASLLEDGNATARVLAKRLGKSDKSLYRMLRELEEKGFVTTFKGEQQPLYFYAIKLDIAVQKLSLYQQHVVVELRQHNKP